MSTSAPAPRPLAFADVCALAGDRTFARLREDGITLVLREPFLVRDHLLATAPETYVVTDHHRGHPATLVRRDPTDGAEQAGRRRGRGG